MPNTYSQIYIHTVFAVKYRQAVISESFKSKLFGVMGTVLNETECETILINGVEDHAHCLFRLMPKFSVSEILQKIKSRSSLWLNSNKLLEDRFEWQSGFGAFSVSYSDLDRVYNYVLNQEQHHNAISFKDEYIQLLKEHNIDYKSEYIFHDLIP